MRKHVSEITSQHVTLSVADGTSMNAYVATPAKRSGFAPGIIVFQEAFGVNAHIKDVTERFARLGFVAVAPELFHRTAEPGFEGSYTDFESVRPHFGALGLDGLLADIDAAYGFLTECADVDDERIAAAGFCLGGRMTYLANARVKLRAGISFYGGGIAPDLLDRAAQQHAPLLMFWGGLDAHIPAEQYRAVADALTAAGKVHEQVVFGQADHGFFCDQRASYNAIAAHQAWALALEFFRAYEVF